jgi:hypothetical protein
MRELADEPGVLPLLDIDRGSPPAWFVTPLATPVAAHFRAAPDFRRVVECFATYADTLARLRSDRGLAHRDLKPDNLFMLDGRPVIGDFGIATWAERGAKTMAGRKMGPLYYMTPEMRQVRLDHDPHPADVYSLAKSLWAVAADQVYAPDGPLSRDRDSCLLYRFGGRAAMDLALLMELATADRPYDRPTAQRFRDELRAWLDLHPPGDVTVEPPRRSRIRTWPFWAVARHVEPDVQLRGALRAMLGQLQDLHSGFSVRKAGHALLATYQLGIAPDEAPDAFEAFVLRWEDVDEEVILAAVLDGDVVWYLGEWQLAQPTGKQLVSTRKGAARFGMPSELVCRAQIVDEMRDAADGQRAVTV